MIALLGVALLGCQPEEPAKKDREPTGFERREILDRPPGNQQTTNVRLASIGWGEGVELVVSESKPEQATWVGCDADGCRARNIPLPRGLVPVRAAPSDLDADGDVDLVFASIGSMRPTNDRVGSVWVLWSEGETFTPERIAVDMGRTACAEPGDLDGDGDIDLALCVFGHVTVGVFGWLEQTAAGWEKHVLDPEPGAIHSFARDVRRRR